jgi:DNA-binding FadR family transcriptional regulator
MCDSHSANHNGLRADRVVSTLEARISSGELKDCEALPSERVLMQEFGSSRTVIREAISTLANRGLIENLPRRRPIVRRPDYQTVITAAGHVVRHLVTDSAGIKNLYDSRIFIERALVRDAATSATKSNITALSDALDANHAAIQDSLEFYRTDTEFHGALYKVPSNPVFPGIHESYKSWLSPHWDRMLCSPEHNTMNFASHKAIFDAIVDRDPHAADTALTNHLMAAWEFVRTTFNNPT